MADEQKEKETKTKRPTAQKRDLQNEKKRLINKMFKSRVHTALRAFDEALQAKDKTLLQERLDHVYSLMDQSVKKGICKLNKASRQKARANQKASSLLTQ